MTGGAIERAGGALPPPTLYVKKRPGMRVSAVDECHGLVYWSNECFTVRSKPV